MNTSLHPFSIKKLARFALTTCFFERKLAMGFFLLVFMFWGIPLEGAIILKESWLAVCHMGLTGHWTPISSQGSDCALHFTNFFTERKGKGCFLMAWYTSLETAKTYHSYICLCADWMTMHLWSVRGLCNPNLGEDTKGKAIDSQRMCTLYCFEQPLSLLYLPTAKVSLLLISK